MPRAKKGRMDPARTLALLWQTEDKPSRGPKQGLTLDRIVGAAVEIADAEGLDALTMRKVAEAVGVGTMSLYTYVPGRAELVNCMLDRVLGEAPDLDQVAGGWRAALKVYAQGSWAIAQRHPWVPPLFGARMLMGPNETAVSDAALRTLVDSGLNEREMLAVVNLVNGYVRGIVQHGADVEQDVRRSGLSYDEWYEESAPLLERLIPFSRYPTLTSVWQSGVFEERGGGLGPDGGFEFGLELVLDGIEGYINRRTRPAPSRGAASDSAAEPSSEPSANTPSA
jgi:AcrR family transcriptional regulator